MHNVLVASKLQQKPKTSCRSVARGRKIHTLIYIPMRFTTISKNTATERPLTAFSLLLSMLSEVSSPLKESCVNIVVYRIFDHAEIHETTQTVSRLNFEIKQEWQDLKYKKIGFVNSWATDHNDFFKTAMKNLDEMSRYIVPLAEHVIAASGYSSSDEIGNSNPGEVQERALAPSLNGNAVQGRFGDNSYPIEVKNLISNITGFLELYFQCRHFCQETLQEEYHVAFKDYGTGTEKLYKLFARKALGFAKEATKYFSADKVEELKRTLPIYQDYEKWNSFEKFAFFGYHRYTPEEVNQFIMILHFEFQNNIFTPTQEEISIFGNDGEKILQCRYIIRHFDELLPASVSGKSKLDGATVDMFIRWADTGYGKYNKTLLYFNREYMKSELNTHETVGYVAAKGPKERQKKYLEGMPPEYMDFVNKVEYMLAKYNSEKKTA